MVPLERIELSTPPLPRVCSTSEPQRHLVVLLDSPTASPRRSCTRCTRRSLFLVGKSIITTRVFILALGYHNCVTRVLDVHVVPGCLPNH